MVVVAITFPKLSKRLTVTPEIPPSLASCCPLSFVSTKTVEPRDNLHSSPVIVTWSVAVQPLFCTVTVYVIDETPNGNVTSGLEIVVDDKYVAGDQVIVPP